MNKNKIIFSIAMMFSTFASAEFDNFNSDTWEIASRGGVMILSSNDERAMMVNASRINFSELTACQDGEPTSHTFKVNDQPIKMTGNCHNGTFAWYLPISQEAEDFILAELANKETINFNGSIFKSSNFYEKFNEYAEMLDTAL
ncbi:TPA: hypothetical protein ACPVXU_000069 [Vibrio parahaemolyticus]|nr:hypothetical protein [Vibrio parahaemolyticus]